MKSQALTKHRPQAISVPRAKAELGRCRSIPEAKEIHDKATAFKTYLKKRGFGIEQQNEAAEIILTAERKMGEILAGIHRRPGLRLDQSTLGNVAQGSPYAKALEAFGLSRRDAARWQQLAAIPEDEFEGRVTTVREKMLQLTLFAILDKVSKGKAASPSIQDRRTPRWLFDELNRRFGPFVCDLFASNGNALLPDFFTIAQDANAQDWPDVSYGNPEFEAMERPLERATQQAVAGVRSVILGPVGGSQEWYHKQAIQGTIYVPDCRISYDEPDGTPTDRADRDTIIMAFGREHQNPDWQDGKFRVQALPLKHLKPNGRG